MKTDEPGPADAEQLAEAIRACQTQVGAALSRRLEIALRRGESGASVQRLLSHASAMQLRHSLRGGLPLPVIPEGQNDQGIVLGTSTNLARDGGPVVLPLGGVCQHMGVVGQTGVGKTWWILGLATQIITTGVPVWWFDRTGDATRLITNTPRETVRWISPEWMAINPFEPPGNVARWRSTIVELLTAVFYGRSGAEMVLSRVLDDAYTAQAQGHGGWPTARDVEERIRDLHPKKWSRSAGYYESALRVITAMRDGLPKTVDARRSVRWDHLAATSCVFDVSHLSVQTYVFFVMLLLEATTQSPSVERGVRVVVIDEAAEVFNEHQVRRQDRGHPPQHAVPRRYRAKGVGLVVGEQTPSLLPRDVFSNLGTIVTFRLADERCRRETRMALGAPPEFSDVIGNLPARHAVVRVVGGERAWLARVPDLDLLAGPSREALRAAREEMMAGLKPPDDPSAAVAAEPGSVAEGASGPEEQHPTPRNKGDGLVQRVDDVALEVWRAVCEQPELTIAERCEVAGVDRQAEWKARGWLETQGLIEPAGKVGRWRFWTVTEKGREAAAERGWTAGRWKSGALHEIVVRRAENALEAAGGGCRRGVSVGGVEADSVCTWTGGACVAVQVSVSNKAVAEAEAAVRLARGPGVDEVLVVCVDREKAGRVCEAVEEVWERGARLRFDEDVDVGVVPPCGGSTREPTARDAVVVMSAEDVLRRTKKWRAWAGKRPRGNNVAQDGDTEGAEERKQ